MKKMISFLILLSILFFVSMESIAKPSPCTCPCGNFVVKFEWKGGSFKPEGGDAKGIMITSVTLDKDSEPIEASWTSSQWLICAVSIKHGRVHKDQTFSPSVTSGTSATPDKHAISHLDFCRSDNPVPVELITFTTVSGDGHVTLNWTTGSETENLGYHVYRSLTEDAEYERITEALIEGAGSSRTTRTYRFIDRDVQEGMTYFYKIEDVDFSGNIRMHGPVSVFVVKAKPRAFALWQNHPNPFNPTTVIAYDLPEGSDVVLMIYTLTGQQVAVLVSGHQEVGHYAVVWDASGFGDGVYFYRLEAGGFVETRRMVLLK